VSLLDANLGGYLRQMREARLAAGRVRSTCPAHSVVLCAGLATERDDADELLVRALREARRRRAQPHGLGDDRQSGPDKADLVSTVFLTYPVDESLAAWMAAALELRAVLPTVLLASIRLPFDRSTVPQDAIENHVDIVLRSYEEALAFVTPERPARA
jgi:hypothetical protein